MAAVAITPATRIPSVISSRCARIRRVGCDANLRRCVRGAAARAGQPPHGNSHLLRRLQWPTLRVKAATTGAPLGRGCRLEAVASSSADAAACSTPETDAKKQLFTSIVIGVGVAALALAFPYASLAAAKSKAAATVAAGPLPFLPFSHNQILRACNLGSLPAWICLTLFPRWRFTKSITLAVAVAYSALYVMLIYVLFSQDILSVTLASFSTTEGVARMFSNATAVLAGWAHFIVFDLWTARYFVLDSGRNNIPHLAIVPCILGCMFFGPLGLLTYFCVKKVFNRINTSDPMSTKTYTF